VNATWKAVAVDELVREDLDFRCSPFLVQESD